MSNKYYVIQCYLGIKNERLRIIYFRWKKTLEVLVNIDITCITLTMIYWNIPYMIHVRFLGDFEKSIWGSVRKMQNTD